LIIYIQLININNYVNRSIYTDQSKPRFLNFNTYNT